MSCVRIFPFVGRCGLFSLVVMNSHRIFYLLVCFGSILVGWVTRRSYVAIGLGFLCVSLVK